MSFFNTCDEASTAFYSAFEMNDMQLMQAVWADSGVSCIHPGSLPIIERDEIISSWAQILKNVKKPVILVDLIQQSGNGGIVIQLVLERFATGHIQESVHTEVVATNVFVEQSSGWRIQQHHASPARPVNAVSIDQSDQKYMQ